jgi:hypothetical protein
MAFDVGLQKALNHYEPGLYDKMPISTRVGLLSAYYNLSLLVVNDDMLAALSRGAKTHDFTEAANILANSAYRLTSNGRHGEKFHVAIGYGDVSKADLKTLKVDWKNNTGHITRRLMEAALVAGHDIQVGSMNALVQMIKDARGKPVEVFHGAPQFTQAELDAAITIAGANPKSVDFLVVNKRGDTSGVTNGKLMQNSWRHSFSARLAEAAFSKGPKQYAIEHILAREGSGQKEAGHTRY